MIAKDKIIIPMLIDSHNQWFVDCWILLNSKIKTVRFKVDTGCNALVLSHDTLERFGYSTHPTKLSKLSPMTGTLASGDKHVFRKIGVVSLYRDIKRTVHICDAKSICHSSHETHDLLGTEVLRQFGGVTFSLDSKKFIELRRKCHD